MAWAWVSLLSVVARRRLHPPARARGHHRPGDPLLGRRRRMRRSDHDSQTHAARRPRHRRRRRRACGPRSRRRRPARTSASSASRCSARPTRSWPRAASRRPSATSPPADSWQVHFRDTMVGGKLLNNPRMAQLHAQEAPGPRPRAGAAGAPSSTGPRDGRILQRPFGGHSHPRLAHVGDRTGLEMIRTLQDRAVAAGHRRSTWSARSPG